MSNYKYDLLIYIGNVIGDRQYFMFFETDFSMFYKNRFSCTE